MKKINPDVKANDRIVCLRMKGEPEYTLERGTVSSILDFGKYSHININWDNNKLSTFPLLSDSDNWVLEDLYDKKKSIKESKYQNVNELSEDANILKYFKMQQIKKYLDKLRDSGITNMFGSSSYLYIGEDILRKEHYNEESDDFEELASMADDIKQTMIRGAIKMLESEDKEVTPHSVSRVVQRMAPKILTFWMRYY
jgi:hypothetical protein